MKSLAFLIGTIGLLIGIGLGSFTRRARDISDMRRNGAVERCVVINNYQHCELICPGEPIIQEVRQ